MSLNYRVTEANFPRPCFTNNKRGRKLASVTLYSRGKIKDSTLEFEGVHLTQKTIFVTDSKNTFTFFLYLWLLFYVYLVKPVEVAAF